MSNLLAPVARAITVAQLAPSAVGIVFDAPPLAGHRRDAIEVDLHVNPLSGDHPGDDLLGFRAPAHWDAFGVTVTGRTVPEADRRHAPMLDDGQALAVTFLVDRAGATVAALRPAGDDPKLVVHDGSTTGPAEGQVADLCRRVLGLPTPPPSRSPSDLMSTFWLDRVVASTLEDPGHPPSWEVVAARHPVLAWMTNDRPGPVDAPEVTLACAGRAFADRVDWHRLRTSPLARDLGPAPVEPHVPAWMDDGMFCRWAFDRLPELADLRAVLGETLSARVAALVDDALRAWEVDW
jgi:hypothetical protein